MPYRPITSRDVASLPQPGFNLADSIRFSPDDGLLTYLRSPNQTLSRQLYAYNIKTDKEFVYAAPDSNNNEENLSMEEKLRREGCVFPMNLNILFLSFFFFLASTSIDYWYNSLSMGKN